MVIPVGYPAADAAVPDITKKSSGRSDDQDVSGRARTPLSPRQSSRSGGPVVKIVGRFGGLWAPDLTPTIFTTGIPAIGSALISACEFCGPLTTDSSTCPISLTSLGMPMSPITTAARCGFRTSRRAAGPVVLLLHGEPSWSFLYRKVMAVLAEAAGCGRSPSTWWASAGRTSPPVGDHTYARHVEWVRSLVFDVLDLTDVTLVGQDWGGLIGLRLAAEHPAGSPGWWPPTPGCPPGTSRCRRAGGSSAARSRMPRVWTSGGTPVGLPHAVAPEVLAAYEAPFPGRGVQGGAAGDADDCSRAARRSRRSGESAPPGRC